MKKLFYSIAALIITASLYSCKKMEDAYIDVNAPAPAQVSGLKTINTPGGAIITYKLPVDPNLSYVKAVYEIQPGVFKEAKSSYYTDTLSIEGFGDTLSHEVKIYSVGKNEKQSESLSLTVNPLTPPVKTVFETLTLESTFGGVSVSFKNITQANIAIYLMVDTTGQGTWAPVTTYYTGALQGEFAARGFEPVERKFAVYIEDHWNNKSDTLFEVLTPMYEQLVPHSLFKAVHLPGDFWQSVTTSYPLEHAFDGIANVSENIFATIDNISQPQWFTVDLGQKVIFSRMKLYQRTSYPYNAVWVKSFEIWGSNAPNPDGSWDSWQKLGAFEAVKPSGLPQSQYTAADMDYEKAGEDYNFPQPAPFVRYIRFKMTNSYAGTGRYQLGELTFWGQIVP